MIEVNSSSPVRTEVADAIGRAVMQWQDETQAYDEAVGEKLGLNGAERRCLGFLHGGPQPAGAIAATVGLTPAAVTSLLDRLEARGLLKRGRTARDRRKVMVEITPEARMLAERYYGAIAREGAAALGAFGTDELAVVLRFMNAALDLQRRHLAALRSEAADSA
jgi:DNA-binding MarR family transcriptional regulator